MAGRGVVQLAGILVQAADKEGYEHVAVVTPAKFGIEDGQNTGRILLRPGNHTEKGMGHRHQHGRGCPLSSHVADAEEQLAVTGIKVEDISAHFPGRLQGAIHKGRERLGKHFLLNAPGDRKFAAHAGLFRGRFPELGFTAGETLDHESENGQAQEH